MKLSPFFAILISRSKLIVLPICLDILFMISEPWIYSQRFISDSEVQENRDNKKDKKMLLRLRSNL